MAKQFAYVGRERHDFEPWMRKKRSWRIICTCRRMLEKSGGLEEVEAAWKEHVRKEGEIRELEVFWYYYPT
jgi:hypothetical protein